MDAFPAFLPLAGARVVVAGAGAAADAKARLFEGAPCELLRLADAAEVDAERCAGARLVFLAGEDEALLRVAGARARAAGALVNVVDRPALSDFATPSIVDRGAVVGAVGTGGAAPVLAVRLRQEIEARWPQRLGALALLLQHMRAPARAQLDSMDARRRYFTRLLDGEAADAALAGDGAQAEALARAALAEEAAPEGRAWVLALPAEPDLLSLRAVRRLGAADRLMLDGAVDPAVLAHARRDAPREPFEAGALRDHIGAGESVAVLTGDAGALAARLANSGVRAERLE